MDHIAEREDTPRLNVLLSSPQEITPRIVDLINQLTEKSVHVNGVRGEYKNELVKRKWQILDKMVEGRQSELEENGLWLYVGGSLLYQDPSTSPDYDLVVFSLEKNPKAREIAREIESDLYELDPEVEIADVVPMSLGQLRTASSSHPIDRSSLHYLNHVLTGYPLFVPSRFSTNISTNVRDHLVNDYLAKDHTLGALAIIDLENVLALRNQRSQS